MTNFSLRIDEEIFEKIKKLADSENNSVNHVINNLLEKSTIWNIHASSAGWIPMPKMLLMELIEMYSYEQIESLARKLGKEIARDILLFTHCKYDVDSWIDFLKIRASIAGFQFSEQRDGKIISFVLHHGMGKKWTVWFKSFYEMVLLDMKASVSFEVTENTLHAKIQK
ncbi:MAG TPA: hypothetical protein VJ771_04770 [Candidatus Nitrosotalea sp.]|nr:hypothetical protein [Candidatus Nitrosotalea sp.]